MGIGRLDSRKRGTKKKQNGTIDQQLFINSILTTQAGLLFMSQEGIETRVEIAFSFECIQLLLSLY